MTKLLITLVIVLAAAVSFGNAIKCHSRSLTDKSSQVVTCGNSNNTVASVLSNTRDNINNPDVFADPQYDCYTVTLEFSANNRTVEQGCLVMGTEVALCQLVAGISSTRLKSALVCSTDECNKNHASMTQNSILITFVVFGSVFYK